MNRTIWLASGSPRRRDLLSWSGYTVEVRPSHIEERREEGESAVAYTKRLALEKSAGIPVDRVGIAADTVVHLGDRVFEKPKDKAEAIEFLKTFSGGEHSVTTGVCVRFGERVENFSVTSTVRFRTLSEAEIIRYVDTGDSADKAGAYGIQSEAGSFVAEVCGSWTNVMGLPMEEVLSLLREMDVDAL